MSGLNLNNDEGPLQSTKKNLQEQIASAVKWSFGSPEGPFQKTKQELLQKMENASHQTAFTRDQINIVVKNQSKKLDEWFAEVKQHVAAETTKATEKCTRLSEESAMALENISGSLDRMMGLKAYRGPNF